ncbi:MAG: hypothetical protein GXP55_16815 [Deltaproteobacteria bacterium]|nr:hypothetical protein [Deltaproteobacteria bacterium]
MTKFVCLAALLSSGCSLVVRSGGYSGDYDGGVADTGAGDSAVDTGPRDGGRDTGPSPDGGDAGPTCGAGEHWSNVLGDCAAGSMECDPSAPGATCTPGESCRNIVAGDGTWCLPDGGIICRVPADCDSGQRCEAGACVPDAPVSGCSCDPGELCVQGACLPSGGCASDGFVPDCITGTAGDSSAFRISSTPISALFPPSIWDLHIVGSIASPGGTLAGWSMVWRDDSGTPHGAYADAMSAGVDGCFLGGDLGTVTDCTGTDLTFDHMDARTLYVGSSDPNNVVGTSTGSSLELWQLRTSRAASDYPTDLCLDFSSSTSTGSNPTGVSLAAMGPTPGLFATVGSSTMTFFPTGTTTFSPLSALRGPLAAGYDLALYSNMTLGSFSAWSGGTSGGTYWTPPDMSSSSDPVAAIDPSSVDLMDTFAFALDSGKLEVITCLPGSPPDCMLKDTMVAPLVLGRPIAAYSNNTDVTVLALEDLGDASGSMELTARSNLSGPRPLLTELDVGGRITYLFAVDAEGVAGLTGSWEFAWAAFVMVEREGNSSLELWTGVERPCGG